MSPRGSPANMVSLGCFSWLLNHWVIIINNLSAAAVHFNRVMDTPCQTAESTSASVSKSNFLLHLQECIYMQIKEEEPIMLYTEQVTKSSQTDTLFLYLGTVGNLRHVLYSPVQKSDVTWTFDSPRWFHGSFWRWHARALKWQQTLY